MCCEESLPLGEIDLLFVQDLGGSWRDSGNGSESQHVSIASLGPQFSAFQLVNGFLNSGKTMPLVVVNVGRKLPEVNVNPDTGGLEFVQPFWQWLSRRPDQVCVMCSATAIRHGGAAVSRRLSWEQTVEDFATELLYFEPLRALTAFRHLIVRFGQVGAVHVHTDGRRRTAGLVFAPLAKDGVYRDAAEDGRIYGKNTLLSISLIKEFAKSVSRQMAEPTQPQILEALKTGLLAGMQAFDAGYPKETLLFEAGPMRGTKFIQDVVGDKKSTFVQIFAEEYHQRASKLPFRHRLGAITVPNEVLDRPAGIGPNTRPQWLIFRQQLDGHLVSIGDEVHAVQMSRINLGMAIVKYGYECVLNREWPDRSGIPEHVAKDIREILTRPAALASSEECGDHATRPMNQLPALGGAPPRRSRRMRRGRFMCPSSNSISS